MNEVIRAISPNDAMYRKGFDAAYFRSSESALHCVDAGLAAAGRKRPSIRRILDLPCGHGRVLRSLRSAFPESEIVACDIDRDGVDFCRATFEAIPEYSEPDPADIALKGPFDLIWVGSLFTHLPKPAWSGFFRLFESVLATGGVLVFTTAGPFVAGLIEGGELGGISREGADGLLRDFGCNGFGFARYQTAEKYEYGRAVAKPWYVLQFLEQYAGMEMLTYQAKAWDGRQDVYAMKRISRSTTLK